MIRRLAAWMFLAIIVLNGSVEAFALSSYLVTGNCAATTGDSACCGNACNPEAAESCCSKEIPVPVAPPAEASSCCAVRTKLASVSKPHNPLCKCGASCKMGDNCRCGQSDAMPSALGGLVLVDAGCQSLGSSAMAMLPSLGLLFLCPEAPTVSLHANVRLMEFSDAAKFFAMPHDVAVPPPRS